MAYREMAVEHLGGECAECGSQENLEIHHIDGNQENNQRHNLKLLCKNCHAQKTSNRFKRIEESIKRDFTIFRRKEDPLFQTDREYIAYRYGYAQGILKAPTIAPDLWNHKADILQVMLQDFTEEASP